MTNPTPTPKNWREQIHYLFRHGGCAVTGYHVQSSDTKYANRFTEDVVIEIIASILSETVEEEQKWFTTQLDEAIKKKFPIGERQWCIKCAQRIAKYIKSQRTHAREMGVEIGGK